MENRCLIGGTIPLQLADYKQVEFIFTYYGNHNAFVFTSNTPEPKRDSECSRFT